MGTLEEKITKISCNFTTMARLKILLLTGTSSVPHPLGQCLLHPFILWKSIPIQSIPMLPPHPGKKCHLHLSSLKFHSFLTIFNPSCHKLSHFLRSLSHLELDILMDGPKALYNLVTTLNIQHIITIEKIWINKSKNKAINKSKNHQITN